MNVPRRFTSAMGLASALICFTSRAAELPTSTPAAEGLSEEKLQIVHEIMNGLVRDRHIAGGIVLTRVDVEQGARDAEQMEAARIARG